MMEEGKEERGYENEEENEVQELPKKRGRKPTKIAKVKEQREYEEEIRDSNGKTESVLENSQYNKILERLSPRRYKGQEISGVVSSGDEIDYKNIENYTKKNFGGGEYMFKVRDNLTGQVDPETVLRFSIPGKPIITEILQESEGETSETSGGLSSEIKRMDEQIILTNKQAELRLAEKRLEEAQGGEEELKLPPGMPTSEEKMLEKLEKTQEAYYKSLTERSEERVRELERQLREKKDSPSIWSNPAIIASLLSAAQGIVKIFMDNSSKNSEQIKQWIEMSQKSQREQLDFIIETLRDKSNNAPRTDLGELMGSVVEVAQIISGKGETDTGDGSGMDSINKAINGFTKLLDKVNGNGESAGILPPPTGNATQVEDANRQIADEIASSIVSRIAPIPVAVPPQKTINNPVTEKPIIEGDIGMSLETGLVQNTLNLLLVDLVRKSPEPKWVDYAYEEYTDELLDKVVQINDMDGLLKFIKPYLTPELENKLMAYLSPMRSPIGFMGNINYIQEGLVQLKKFLEEERMAGAVAPQVEPVSSVSASQIGIVDENDGEI